MQLKLWIKRNIKLSKDEKMNFAGECIAFHDQMNSLPNPLNWDLKWELRLLNSPHSQRLEQCHMHAHTNTTSHAAGYAPANVVQT